MKTTICKNRDKLHGITLVITEEERKKLSSSLFDIMFTRYSNHKNDPILRTLYNEVTESRPLCKDEK
jgi:hypothetical protein